MRLRGAHDLGVVRDRRRRSDWLAELRNPRHHRLWFASHRDAATDAFSLMLDSLPQWSTRGKFDSIAAVANRLRPLPGRPDLLRRNGKGVAGQLLGGNCCLLGDSCGRSELPRRDADEALEVVGELALVTEAGVRGDLRQGNRSQPFEFRSPGRSSGWTRPSGRADPNRLGGPLHPGRVARGEGGLEVAERSAVALGLPCETRQGGARSRLRHAATGSSPASHPVRRTLRPGVPTAESGSRVHSAAIRNVTTRAG